MRLLNSTIAIMRFNQSVSPSMQTKHKTDSTKYSADVNVTIAAAHGCNSKIETKENTKAGNGPQNLCRGPKASVKNAYSPPDRGTTAPNSAKAKAPVIKHGVVIRFRLVVCLGYLEG